MNERPSEADIAEALVEMSEIIPFFPTGERAVDIVRRSLANFVSTAESLRWLVYTAVNTMAKFSLPELRAIYCTRYTPLDGIVTASVAAGFRPDETSGPQRYLERESEETARKLEQWKREQAKETAAPRQREEPIAMPTAKPMPRAVRKMAAPRRWSAEPTEEQVIVPRAGARTPEEKAAMVAELEKKLARRMKQDVSD